MYDSQAVCENKTSEYNWGDLILIEAILIEFCISIKIHLIIIEMMKIHFDPNELYFNRSTCILSIRLLYSGTKSKLRNSVELHCN